MPNASLRRSGVSLTTTTSAASAEQNGLDAGSSAAVELLGAELTLRTLRKRHSLAALLAQTPRGAWRTENWDTMAPVGREL